MLADYLDRLVAQAAAIQDAHGGNPVWWVEHDRKVCAACLAMAAKLTSELQATDISYKTASHYGGVA